MTFLPTFLLITAVSAGHLVAQEKPEESPAPAPATNAPPPVLPAPAPPETNSVAQAASEDTLVAKEKGSSASAAARVEAAAPNEFWRGTSQLVKSFNPFAPVEARPGSATVAGESSRAWTTTVGWNPGGSAFPDALTHESQLSVISVPPTRKP